VSFHESLRLDRASQDLKVQMTLPMSIWHLLTAPPASVVAATTLVGTQAMTGRESAVAVLFGFSAGWFLLFAVAGALPLLVEPVEWKAVVEAFVAFGLGGGTAGGVIATLLITHRLGGSFGAVIVTFAIPFIIPWSVGAAIMYFYFRRPKVP
jgi:hypothetical protein